MKSRYTRELGTDIGTVAGNCRSPQELLENQFNRRSLFGARGQAIRGVKHASLFLAAATVAFGLGSVSLPNVAEAGSYNKSNNHGLRYYGKSRGPFGKYHYRYFKRHCPEVNDIALIGGKIHTMDKHNSVVHSVRVIDDKIVSVGKGLRDTNRCTEVINLRGRTVVPGLIDNHNHIILLGLRPGNDVRLDKANSIQDALDLLAEKAAEVEPGEWVVSLGGFNINQFTDPPEAPRYPTIDELDNALPNNPVLLFQGFSGPSQTNSQGRDFINASTAGDGFSPPAAADGSIGSGFGADSPSLRALQVLRELPEHNNLEAQKQGLIDALQFGASVGLTTHIEEGSFHFTESYFGNPGTSGDFFASVLASFDEYRAFDSARALRIEGNLPARIQINYLHQDTSEGSPALQQRLLNTVPFLGDEWLSNGGIGEFTARDAFSGSANVGPVGQAAARLVAQAGWRNENHSLGSSDFADILDMWSAINDELKTTGISQPIGDPVVNPDGITKLRWVVAHVPFITPEYIGVSKDLGVGLSVLGGWRWISGSGTNQGPPFRTIVDSGVHAGMSSDGMQISVMDPWAGMYYAVTGKNARGELINDGQQISREEVLRLYTADNAWFLGPVWEKYTGSIEPGKWADLVVLSADYFDSGEVSDEEIIDIYSVMTMVNGKIVHTDW